MASIINVVNRRRKIAKIRSLICGLIWPRYLKNVVTPSFNTPKMTSEEVGNCLITRIFLLLNLV